MGAGALKNQDRVWIWVFEICFPLIVVLTNQRNWSSGGWKRHRLIGTCKEVGSIGEVSSSASQKWRGERERECLRGLQRLGLIRVTDCLEKNLINEQFLGERRETAYGGRVVFPFWWLFSKSWVGVMNDGTNKGVWITWAHGVRRCWEWTFLGPSFIPNEEWTRRNLPVATNKKCFGSKFSVLSTIY